MKKKEPAFEEGLARLEELVGRLEDRRLGLDQALTAFEEGLALSQILRKKLDAAASRVEILTRDLAGRPQSEPFEIAVGLQPGRPAGDEADDDEELF